MITSFPFFRQYDTRDCGPSCLKMILMFYGKTVPLNTLRSECQISKSGVSLLGLELAAKHIGFEPLSASVTPTEFQENHLLPCIVHWKQNHFVVVYKITKDYIYVADPSKGKIKYKIDHFNSAWLNPTTGEGTVLFLEHSGTLLNIPEDTLSEGITMKRFYQSMFKFKRLIFLLFVSIVIGGVLQLIFPFLTKAILDLGVANKSLQFISLILLAQTMLFLGQMTIDYIKRWILLYISTRINLSILTNFLQKLMKLPAAFFDTKHVGDMMQRLNDHNRIEAFLTGSSVSSLFSLLTLTVLGGILAYYNFMIFSTFIIGSACYIFWVTLFLRKRKSLDMIRFDLQSKNQSKVVELINGMHDIKLNLVQNKKRWEWEKIQANLFTLNIDILKLNQFQEIGGNSINQIKNILITFLSARAVILGTLSLGEMLSIQYIIGQLNSPIDQLMGFLQSGQEAKLSMDRLNEVHQMENEEKANMPSPDPSGLGDIRIRALSFSYPGPQNLPVLKKIDLDIIKGEVTAIVGASGSGKTTLIKLLLMLYDADSGSIEIGKFKQTELSQSFWRSNCGTVLQDGYIFSDTIANNIALEEHAIDEDRLVNAAKTANIESYINDLPLKYETVIGSDGAGLSQGQKQRILIARAVYKNPQYIFLDEATNALDASNENVIMKNLDIFFKDKTVLVVAHRLSTVKNAKKIIVLNQGEIIETGTHKELTDKKGYYYQLVKDQLELGS